MSTPKRQRLSASRTSLSARKSLQGGSSALPRPTSTVNAGRLTSTQPTYDFLGSGAAGESQQPLRRSVSLRQSQAVRPDATNDENLRARINTLEYELKNLQQDRNLLVIRHNKEVRDLQAKADADFKKYQGADGASKKVTQQCDALAQELREVQDQRINEKAGLERKLRDLQGEVASLREDTADTQAQLADQERQHAHQVREVETKRAALQQTTDSLRQDLEQANQALEAAQSHAAQRDIEVGGLEAQVDQLKSHTGDSEALVVVQRELSDQVAHIRKLETTNREQLAELRRLRDAQRSVQVVEEQKRALETEIHVLKDVHRQLGEAQIQKEILEDEKQTWVSLLEREGQDTELQSPEAIVKALVQERIEHASILDRLGIVESESSEKDEMITLLELDKESLNKKLASSISSSAASTEGGHDGKAYKRLERQRVLAMKEVEYLRAQLKTFDTEETVLMEHQNFDSQRLEQIQRLEDLVDQYKAEVQALHDELTQLEKATRQPSRSPEHRGTKRAAESQDPDGAEGGSSQLGPLLRKNKNLQTALQKVSQQSQMLATELQAAKSQLKSLRASSKIRVLELRDNPSAIAEATKASTLKTLKDENAALLTQLRGEDLQGIKVVPISTVDALKLDLQEMEKVVAEKEKRMRRLREIWTDKAAEFRDVIASVLGYRVTFLPNGKVKVGSMFYGGRKEAGNEPDEDENFIMFDGENGTMKISGGPNGQFGKEVKQLVDFWVQGKKEIPCFLAAMTLEFYEKFAQV